MSALLSCTYWLQLNNCFVWNREEVGLEGVDQEEPDTDTDLSRLGESSFLQDHVEEITESFICSIYASGKSFVNNNYY